MQNWIGIAIWILMGATMGLIMKALIRRPEEQPGNGPVIMVLGAYAACIGGMLGVGTFELFDPMAISPGGMFGAAGFSLLCTFLYRWGLRAMI